MSSCLTRVLEGPTNRDSSTSLVIGTKPTNTRDMFRSVRFASTAVMVTAAGRLKKIGLGIDAAPCAVPVELKLE